MPNVYKLKPDELDKIHIQRMDHAFKEMVEELIELRNPVVDYILARWGIIIRSKGLEIEYPKTARQILEKELIELHKRQDVVKKSKKLLTKK